MASITKKNSILVENCQVPPGNKIAIQALFHGTSDMQLPHEALTMTFVRVIASDCNPF